MTMPAPHSPYATGKVMHERAAPGYHVPPVMVATDPGRERYDGKDVSPVRIVRNEPVSTFSVDVDTGAYANTRRFLSQGALPPKERHDV